MAFETPANVLNNCDGGMLYCLGLWANNVTNGLFWTIITLSFFVVLIMATQRFGSTRSYGFASIAAMLAALFLSTLQLMAWWIGTAFILNGVVGFVILILNEK